MKFSGIFVASMLVLLVIVVSARNMEDNFEETKLNEFEDGNNQRNYFSKDDSVSNVVDATLKRVRRAFCGNRCSCGWGNCVYQKGYQGSICCSSDYAWHCC